MSPMAILRERISWRRLGSGARREATTLGAEETASVLRALAFLRTRFGVAHVRAWRALASRARRELATTLSAAREASAVCEEKGANLSENATP